MLKFHFKIVAMLQSQMGFTNLAAQLLNDRKQLPVPVIQEH